MSPLEAAPHSCLETPFIYSIHKAQLISQQLAKFTSGHAHHLAGQCGNLDFWISEVKQALKTIDEHRHRFNKMRDAQNHFMDVNETEVHNFCSICRGRCEFDHGKPPPPQNRYKKELKQARIELIETTYAFLIRCYKIGLIDRKGLEGCCENIGIGIDISDTLS